MKKAALIIVSILLIALVAVTFVACSTATVQGQLRNVWRPYEKYTYSVTDGDTVGTYVVEIIHNEDKNVTIGTVNLENVSKGIIINGHLNIGGTEYITSCYVQLISGSSYLIPRASYKKQIVDGNVTLELGGTYADGKYNYSGTENGVAKDGSIALASPYYDNNEIHQLLRGVNGLTTGFSFSFNVPVTIGESSSASLSASCSTTETVTHGDNATECYVVSLARSTKVAGKSHKLYYSTKPIKVDGWDLPNVLIQFVEPTADGEIYYTLTSISLTK